LKHFSELSDSRFNSVDNVNTLKDTCQL